MKLKEEIFESEMHSLKNDQHIQLDMVMNENEDKISSLCNEVEKYKNKQNNFNLIIENFENDINEYKTKIEILKNENQK